MSGQFDFFPSELVRGVQAHTVVSMFCGCGGLDLGFRGGFVFNGIHLPRLPFEVVAAYDLDERCVKTYNQNLPPRAKKEDLAVLGVDAMPAADVLLGGFPCQDFALCGPRQGLNSDRGRAFRAMIRYMVAHRPRIVVAENVRGLRLLQRGEVLNTILGEFKDAGYRVEVWTLNAVEHGVPQSRIRLFIIAVRDDLEGFPTEPKRSTANNPRSIKWAIDDLKTVVDETVPNQSQYFKANLAKRGHKQGDKKSRADEPGHTVRANPKSRVHFHYELPRRLTVRECARLQTFPDWFSFPYKPTRSMMHVGNAVPPMLAHRVSKSIATFLAKTI